jgi:hypothetical protein
MRWFRVSKCANLICPLSGDAKKKKKKHPFKGIRCDKNKSVEKVVKAGLGWTMQLAVCSAGMNNFDGL